MDKSITSQLYWTSYKEGNGAKTRNALTNNHYNERHKEHLKNRTGVGNVDNRLQV